MQFVANFRDVGETINLLAGQPLLREGLMYRGGSLGFADESELDVIKSIINLRVGPDNVFPNIECHHLPAPNRIENYNTKNSAVRAWLNKVLAAVASCREYPLYIHCSAGRDRTGVVVALILLSLGVQRELIIEEYAQSDGLVEQSLIVNAIDGLGDVSEYIRDKRIIQHLQFLFLQKNI